MRKDKNNREIQEEDELSRLEREAFGDDEDDISDTVTLSRYDLDGDDSEPDTSEFEDSAPRFVNLAEERPKKKRERRYLKPLLIGGAIILATGIGGTLFYINESSRQTSEAEEDYTMPFYEDKTFEYGKSVYLTPATFVNMNDGEMPEGIKDSIEVSSVLMTNSDKYTYNSTSGTVVSKNKDYLACGTYRVEVTYKVNGESKSQELSFTVKDTKAPEFTKFPKQIYICQNVTGISPVSYVKASDLNGVSFVFKPSQYQSLKKAGTYTVDITAKDDAGNKTTKTMKVTVVSEKDAAEGKTLTKTNKGETPLSDGAKKLKEKAESSVSDTEKAEQEAKEAAEKAAKEAEEKTKEEEAKQNRTGWEGNVYYLHGTMLTGSQCIDGKWYYLDYGTGEKVTNQWLLVNGVNTYYTADGTRASGFTEVPAGAEVVNTYYFMSTGAYQTGWLTYNGNQYYFDENGIELFGTQEINGKTYEFDEKTGALIA